MDRRGQGRRSQETDFDVLQMDAISPITGRYNANDMAHMGNMYGMPLFQSAGPDLRSAAHWLWQVEAAELEGSFVIAEKLFELALNCGAEVRFSHAR